MITTHSTNARYRTRFSIDEHHAFSDVSAARGGAAAGFNPHELLEASVACCINIWLRIHADACGIPLSSVTAEVRLNRESPDEAVFEYRVDLQGDFTTQQRDELEQQIATCPVSKTLLKNISFREMSSDNRSS